MASANQHSTLLSIMRIACYITLLALFSYLFYEEAIGAFDSDIFDQIDAAINPKEDAYTLTKPLFAVLYPIAGFKGIAAFLAICQVGTILVSEKLLRRLAPSIEPTVVFIVAVLCNFTIAIYIPAVHAYFNIGVSEGNEWHNATYTVMRLAAMGALWFFVEFDRRSARPEDAGATRNDALTRKALFSWAWFTLLTVLATAIKPSYVIAFGPALVIFCLIDVIEHGKAALARSLLMAGSMAIALIIIIYQYQVLYAASDATAALHAASNADGSMMEGIVGAADGIEESGIAFGWAVIWRFWHPNLAIAMLQSYAFPLIVLAGCWKNLRKNRNYRVALLMFAVALAEYLLLTETGKRAPDGNFDWGLCFAVYYLMLASSAVFLESKGKAMPFVLLHDARAPRRKHAAADAAATVADGLADETKHMSDETLVESAPANSTRIYCALVILSFALHVGSGVIYLANMLKGFGYY